jgi:hypothetical protein
MRHSNGPREGEFITIKSYKHDGSLHRTWRDTMVLKTSENALIGCNDHTLVTESDGRRWVTREPALMYFHKHYWFNIVTMIRDRLSCAKKRPGTKSRSFHYKHKTTAIAAAIILNSDCTKSRHILLRKVPCDY